MESFNVLSGLAQELDAPLRSLVKSSQKLLDDYKSRNFEYIAYKDFKNIITTLEQINRQLKRCCLTTERMLHLSKRGKSSSSHFCQVNDVIKEIVGLLGQQLESAKARVMVHLDNGLPLAKIGRVECYQVIHNVLINAIQAMPAGGKVKVRTGLDKGRAMVTVDIEDEGIGITPEHLSKVFDPFFTTKERGVEKNAGLGLSIVYSIVHTVGGDVHIQSSLRKGTKVHMDLPVFSA